MNDGCSLMEVSIDQSQFGNPRGEKSQMPFPLLIPYQTTDLTEGTRLPLRWAGVRLSELVNKGSGKGKPSQLLASENIREELRVGPRTKVLPILNGKDDRLAALWEMDRSEFYGPAERHSIEAITGPTFSVYSEQEGDRRTPAAMNVIMQKRHHQVLAEIGAQITATPIPNLYWRDRRDWKKWAGWLEKNQVEVVYRDFTMTRQPENYRPELSGLLEILGRMDRSLHVLVGVGMSKAKWTIRRLAEEGHTCSVVTSDPIHTGVVCGQRMAWEGEEVEEKESNAPPSKLGVENLKVAEAFLESVASECPPYEGLRIKNRVLPQPGENEGRRTVPTGREPQQPTVDSGHRCPGHYASKAES